MQSRQIKAAPPGGLKMQIDQVCSRETQTLSTAVVLQWRYDLCNWMIKVANLFRTLFPAVAQLCVWFLTRHWCAVLSPSLRCVFLEGMLVWEHSVGIGVYPSARWSSAHPLIFPPFDSPRPTLMHTSCETCACFVLEMNSNLMFLPRVFYLLRGLRSVCLGWRNGSLA